MIQKHMLEQPVRERGRKTFSKSTLKHEKKYIMHYSTENHGKTYTVCIPSWNWNHALRQKNWSITWRTLPTRTRNIRSSWQGIWWLTRISRRMSRRIYRRTMYRDHHVSRLRMVKLTSASKLAMSSSQIICAFNLTLKIKIKGQK